MANSAWLRRRARRRATPSRREAVRRRRARNNPERRRFDPRSVLGASHRRPKRGSCSQYALVCFIMASEKSEATTLARRRRWPRSASREEPGAARHVEEHTAGGGLAHVVEGVASFVLLAREAGPREGLAPSVFVNGGDEIGLEERGADFAEAGLLVGAGGAAGVQAQVDHPALHRERRARRWRRRSGGGGEGLEADGARQLGGGTRDRLAEVVGGGRRRRVARPGGGGRARPRARRETRATRRGATIARAGGRDAVRGEHRPRGGATLRMSDVRVPTSPSRSAVENGGWRITTSIDLTLDFRDFGFDETFSTRGLKGERSGTESRDLGSKTLEGNVERYGIPALSDSRPSAAARHRRARASRTDRTTAWSSSAQ